MPHLLVTGFGPFPRAPRNPSAVLAEAVAASPRLGLRGWSAESLVLPVTYAAIDGALRPALAAARPDAVLMLGVAARRREVCVEVQALNRVSRLFPDASGQVGRQLAFRPNVSLRRAGRAPMGTLLAALRSRRVPARLSRDAGRYLCNASYLAALEEIGVPVVFVHVPMPRGAARVDRRPSLREMAVGLVEVAVTLTARRSQGLPSC